MKPYYEHAGITIYHGDCAVCISGISRYDSVVTDPPYGINAISTGKAFQSGNAAMVKAYAPVIGDDADFDPTPLLSIRPTILWGGNHFASRLPDSAAWLVWDKRDGTNSNPMADCELAWTNLRGPARLLSHRWMGMIRAYDQWERVHPTQKPVPVMQWCLGFVPHDGIVLDPFMGSGTTLVAAKNLGRKAIGIEIEERYCEIAAKRLAQEILL